MSRRGWILFIAMCLIWGIPYLCIRVAVRELDPGCLVFARTMPAALVLLPLAWRRGTLSSLRGKMGWLLAYSVIEFGIPWFLMSTAERHISSSLAGLIICTVPLIAVTINKVIHPQQIIGPHRLVGLGLGTLGVAILVGLDVRGSAAGWVGLMLLVAVGYSIGPMILSYRLHESSGLAVAAVSVTAVAVAYAPWGMTHWPSHLHPTTWLACGVLTVICTAVAFTLFFTLIQEVGPSRSVVVTYANTGVAVLLGTVFLNERLTVGILVGFPLVVIGSYYATSRRSVSPEA